MYHIISHARRHYTENNHSCWNCSCLNTPNKPHLSQNLLFNHGLSAYYSALEQTALISFPVMNREFYMEVEKNKDPRCDGVQWLTAPASHPSGTSPSPSPREGAHAAECDLPHIGSPVAHAKRISKSPYSSYFKKHSHIYPCVSQLGGKSKNNHPTFLCGSCGNGS